MSEKWTPGPWRGGTSEGRGLLCVVSDGTWICGELHNQADLPKAEAVANMHLIAAAPELYAALSCFLDDPRFQVGVGGNPNVVVAMISAARAALAKARGEG